jgi:hypothetical protein
MNRFLLVTFLFVVTGCATTSPEPNQSESLQAAESSSNELLEHKNPVEDFENAEVVAENSEGAASEAEKFEGVEYYEPPSESENSAEMLLPEMMPEPEIVCERVYPTGSRLPVRMCRSQAEIELNQLNNKKLDEIKLNSNIL